jgi:hypothetical protein
MALLLRILSVLLPALVIAAWVVYIATPSRDLPRSIVRQHDPIEDDPVAGPLVKIADAEAHEELKGEEQIFGGCHMLWITKKRILKDKYGVDWRTPAEMNPHIIFD